MSRPIDKPPVSTPQFHLETDYLTMVAGAMLSRELADYAASFKRPIYVLFRLSETDLSVGVEELANQRYMQAQFPDLQPNQIPVLVGYWDNSEFCPQFKVAWEWATSEAVN
jgi:hypothetical protein